MDRVIGFCLKNALLLNLLTAFVVVTGLLQMVDMNKEAFPKVDFDVVSVSTIYPGASPREVEHYVTDRLEEEIETVDNLDRVESTSIEGLSSIVVFLDPDASPEDKLEAQNDIQRAVDRTRDLPDELPDPPLVKSIDSGDMPVLEIALTGAPYARLWELAEELEEQLEEIDDIKEVSVRGDREREYWIEVNPDKLRRFNIGLSQIIASLQARNLNLPGGILTTPEGDLLVRTISEFNEPSEVESVVLRTNDAGIQIKLGDVGRIIETFEEEKRIYHTDSKPSINMLVTKNARGDIIDLVDQSRAVTDAFVARFADENIEAAYMNDVSVFVKNRLGVLLNNGIIGIVLVLLVLLVILSRGIAVVAAAGMPIALFGCLMVMGYTGQTVNLISMFGLVIVLGMLVDDAIIVAENIWQHYEAGDSAWDAAINGTKEVFWPVTATILTTIAAFSPLLMISGLFGRFIEVLPTVVIFALVASLIEAMFVLPSHAYDVLRIMDRRKEKHARRGRKVDGDKKPNSVTARFISGYDWILRWTLKGRWIFFTVISALFAFSAWHATVNMKIILFPADGIESFFIRVNQPQGTPLRITAERIVHLEAVLERLPKEEMKNYVTHVGIQQDDPQDPFTKRGSHVAQIQVFLTAEKDRKRTADEISEQIRAEMLSVLVSHGFANLTFSPIRTGPPVGKPVAIRISGDELDTLEQVADQIQNNLASIDGVKDITENFTIGKDEFQVQVDPDAAARALLTSRDIALHTRTAIEGQIATHLRQDGERIALRVRYPEAERNSIETLTESRVLNQAGNLVPLKQVATFDRQPGLDAIHHYGFKRTITVTANLDETRTSSTIVNKEMLAKIEEHKARHPELIFAAGGEYEDTDESMRSLQEAFGVALALIFLILSTQFRSVTQPFVVMVAIPFGAIGVIWAFYFHGMPLSFLGLVGAIGLSGVVVNDSIVLVDFINKARERGQEAFEAAVYAGRRRFRAVWLTTLTTVFGLLPLVYGIGGEDKFLAPAATALSYGLIFGTILVLFLVPAVYLIRLDIGRFFAWIVSPVTKRL